MRIFTEQAIKEYAEAHPDAKVNIMYSISKAIATD